MATCKFCRKEITWVKEGRKNVPIEGDGTVHSCEEMKKTMESIRLHDKSSISPEEIKRYEDAINSRRDKK